jgi:hypothetical protein
MTYNEVIYSIREKLSQIVDDNDIDDREIIFEVNNQRALHLRNQYNAKHRLIDPEVKQVLCVTMAPASPDDCGCGETDCTVMKSTTPLPPLIEFHDSNGLITVAPTGVGSVPFSTVSYMKAVYSGERMYTQNNIFAFLHPNGYLYLKSKSPLHKMIECVEAHVLLENPLDAHEFKYPSGTVCYDPDTSPYPLKAHVLTYITENVLRMLGVKFSFPADVVNDSESDTRVAPSRQPAKSREDAN